MEISRRDNGRSIHEGPPRFDVRRNTRHNNPESPINYNPWNKRFSPIDPEFQPEKPHAYRLHRGSASHHYQRNRHAQRPQASTSNNSNNIPSLLTLELPPKPLLPPEDVEKLRANLRNSFRQMESESYDDYDDAPRYDDVPGYDDAPRYDDVPVYDDAPPYADFGGTPPAMDATMTEDEYLIEEHKTKQQIEEIIAVAQALREKLDREEELRRQAEQQIPKLMDLKPIPSLLEIYVPPPPVTPEETCWNCRCPGHRFIHCNMPKQRKFCYRCGEPGFDASSCPFCKKSR